MLFTELIRLSRENLGLTTKELSEKISKEHLFSISEKDIEEMEKGTRLPEVDEWPYLGAALSVSPEEFGAAIAETIAKKKKEERMKYLREITKEEAMTKLISALEKAERKSEKEGWISEHVLRKELEGINWNNGETP